MAEPKAFALSMNSISGLLVFLLALAGIALRGNAADAPEFYVRTGLPNVAAKLARGEEVRVAFLGGSITAAHGWRVFTMENLRRLHPGARFIEINAAVSGTGSNYGAMRLERDVLRHQPDLIFVEFAVNDGGQSAVAIEAQMEGIVRHTWTAFPRTDICFVCTVSEGMVNDLLAGRYPPSTRAMELVAEHYAIPSFSFGVEVTKRLRAETLVFSAPAVVAADAAGNDTDGRLIFTRDRTHPTDAGHRVYGGRLALALPEFLAAGKAGEHVLLAARRADAWALARIILATELEKDGRWSDVPANDPHRRAQASEALVPPLVAAFAPGATISFHFKGTVLGLIGLKGPENGQFRITVDDLPPQTGTLFDSFSQPGRFFLKPWFFVGPLADTEHRVRLELLPTKIDKEAIMKKAGTPIKDPQPFAAHGLYFGGFLINGEVTGKTGLR